jgi:hypothetical protein
MRIVGRETPSILALAARLPDVDVAVRWGGERDRAALNGNVRLLNGLEQLELFHTLGLPHPDYTIDVADALESHAAGEIIMGRLVNHTQGKDIRFSHRPRVRGQRRWTNSDFWVKFEPSEREWRFHIFQGRAIARGLKVWNGVQAPVTPIRSRRLGWTLEHKTDPPKIMRETAKRACVALDYDFGAVDLLELPDGRPMLLEVNSRPALRDEYTLAAYEKAIRNL